LIGSDGDRIADPKITQLGWLPLFAEFSAACHLDGKFASILSDELNRVGLNRGNLAEHSSAP
jgi:hypothetical protein